MSLEDVVLLLKLYVRPRAAMSAIVDEGSFLFAALAVFLVSLLAQAPTTTSMLRLLAHSSERSSPSRPSSVAPADDGDAAALRENLPAVMAGGSLFGSVLAVGGLALLYVPALIFVMTLVDRRAGSFGVALARDYGALAPCALLSWAAAHLPFSLAALVLAGAAPAGSLAGLLGGLAAWIAGGLYFIALSTLAVRVLYGVGFGRAAIGAVVGMIALPFAGSLAILASPFMLYWVYAYFRSDVSAIQWSLGSRRSLKRHLEAATLNPRDAGAHYQLGLIHQHRRQYDEAIARFRKAVEIDPTEIDAHYQLGRIAREQGRSGDAIAHFESVVSRDPKHSRCEIWREVGGTYVEATDFANARTMLERYVQSRPYDPEGLFLLGLSYKRLGEPEKAREMQARCVEASKTAPDYRQSELRHWRKRAQQEL